jgi:hypothetical protein
MGQDMKTPRFGLWVVLLALLVTGCQSSIPRRRPGGLAANEPGLDGSANGSSSGAGSGSSIVEAPPARTRSISFVDRHPLLYRPRDLYESSGDNVIVKGAAATLVGIPAGLFSEMRQIVVGRPADPMTGTY